MIRGIRIQTNGVATEANIKKIDEKHIKDEQKETYVFSNQASKKQFFTGTLNIEGTHLCLYRRNDLPLGGDTEGNVNVTGLPFPLNVKLYYGDVLICLFRQNEMQNLSLAEFKTIMEAWSQVSKRSNDLKDNLITNLADPDVRPYAPDRRSYGLRPGADPSKRHAAVLRRVTDSALVLEIS
jgi:hypothetical protein